MSFYLCKHIYVENELTDKKLKIKIVTYILTGIQLQFLIVLYIFLYKVEGIMLGSVVASFNVDEVMIALGITVILVFALTIFALQTKIDFTSMGAILMIAVLSLFLFGIFAAIFQSRITNIVYARYRHQYGFFLQFCFISCLFTFLLLFLNLCYLQPWSIHL